ncbi:MAG: hypothetical protein M3R27_14900 [Bacteroidota bacterium]|nr:hypothetical protein [Bacteroidota bacterium]
MSDNTIEKGSNSFTANGKKYIISDKISVQRWKAYEKLVPRLTFGLSFEEIFKNLEKAYAALNKQQFANSAVIIHNVMNGISSIDDEKKVSPALMMCALIINREDENTAEYNEPALREKIKDWEMEGLNMMDFLELALNATQGFRETYKRYTLLQEAMETSTKSSH